MWSKIKDWDAYYAAMTLCRGCYQRALIDGNEALSGSTLKGAAGNFRGRYRTSRLNLLARLTNAGIKWDVEIQDHNRKVLVLG